MNKIIVLVLSLVGASHISMQASYSPAAQQVMNTTQTGPRITAAQLTQVGYYAMPVVGLGIAYKWYHSRYVAPEEQYKSSRQFLATLNRRFNPEPNQLGQERDVKHHAEINSDEAMQLKARAKKLYLAETVDAAVKRELNTQDVRGSLISAIDKISSAQTDGTTKAAARLHLTSVHSILDSRLESKIKQVQDDRKAAKTKIKWAAGITATLAAAYAGIKWFWPGINK
jgi:hypothetical protein